jgi:hypothetical protein
LTDDPRLTEVVVTSRNPLFGDPPRVPILQPSGVVVAAYTFVSPEYFAALQIPIVQGRGFSTQEAVEQARVAVVSAAGARQLWPGEDPVGKVLRLNIGEPGTRVQVADTIKELRKPEDFAAGSFVVTVVGVAKDVVSGFVYSGPDSAHLYFPTSPTGSRAAALMVRRPAGTSVQALKAVLRQAHPDPLAFDVLAMNEMVALQMFPLRAASWIATFLSAVALALSISGLYGVLTYTFGQRTREIGIRMALGATAAAVTRLVIVQSARLAASGTAIGLVLGFSVMKILSASVRLENVSVVDPGAFAVSIAVIAAAVAVSSYGPARRATRVDPSLMLRADA